MTVYQDIDLSFNLHPSTKDILKIYDVQSAKAALRNVLLTTPGEKLDDFDYGCGIKQLQFELYTPPLAAFVRRKIAEQVNIYLPEISLQNINVSSNPDTGEIGITITFYVTGSVTLNTFALVLERSR